MTAPARPRTLFAKLWDAHVVADLGGSDLIAIDRIFLHERTGAAALGAMAAAGRKVADPARVFAVMDHIVDTRPGRSDTTLMPGGQAFITETRAAARAAGITLFDVNDRDQGIIHVISPEQGIVLPGLTLIAPDSHSCTQGAFGALAWGIGSSEAEHAMATGCLRMVRPSTMRVQLTGTPAPGVTAKDLMLALIARHGSGGGKGAAIEFTGSTVTGLDIEARQTLCNMATEFSAMTAIIAPDAVSLAALAGTRYAPADWAAAAADWATLVTDPGAGFDHDISLDTATVEPMVSWGTSPQHSIGVGACIPADAAPAALAYIGL
ncbi:MAG: aconitase family protein, partial [Polymorphobacter sp.]